MWIEVKISVLFILFFVGGNIALQSQIIDYADYNLGISQKNQRQYSKAISSFGKFIKIYPTQYPEAYFQRGKTFLLLRKYEAAVSDWMQVLQLNPVHPDAPYALGKVYFQQKKYEQALTYFTQSIQLNPNHALSFNDRGLVQCELRDFPAALQDFYRAMELDPTFAMAFNNAGAARYFKQDIARPTSMDLRAAKKLFSQAIQKNPTLALAYRNRAAMHILTNDYESAELDLQKAQQLNPSDAMTFFYQGIVFADQYKLQRAFNTFRKALEINLQLMIAHEEMGNLYKSTQQYELAIYQYYQAKIARPDVGKLYVGLLDYRSALVFAEQKNKKKMYASLQQAKENGAFHDQQLYRDFIKAKEFKPYRQEKSFRKFQQSLLKLKKNNKFLNPDLGWFRMR